MPKVSWNDIYSVNIKELDDQHKALVEFINQGYDHLQLEQADPIFFQDFFERLSAHATLHFSTEEKYFLEFSYPDAAEHIAKHDAIKSTITELSQKYHQSHSLDVIFDTLQLLDDWLFEHIMSYDKKYAKFFNDHGLK